MPPVVVLPEVFSRFIFVDQFWSRSRMPATLSPENRISTTLREIGCSMRNFEWIAAELGTRVGHGSFVQALNGKKKNGLDQKTATKLLNVVNRMKELREVVQAQFHVEIDWSSQKVVDALSMLLISTIHV